MPVSPTEQPVLWLTFEAQAQSALDQIIATFAGRHAGVLFPPHVTLPLDLADHDDAMRIAATVAAQARPLSVQIESIDTGPQYYRFLSLRLKPNTALNAMRAHACHLAGSANTAFTPHISLLYQLPDPSLQTRCRRELSADENFKKLAHTQLLLNRLTQMSIGAKVADWRSCATFDLSQ